MAEGRRNIDIGFVVIHNDPSGRPYVRTLENGDVVADPLIALNAYDLPADVSLRFAFWDYDAQQLPTRFSHQVSEEEGASFFKRMHDRMQAWNAEGGSAALRQLREKDEEIARLRARIPSTGAND